MGNHRASRYKLKKRTPAQRAVTAKAHVAGLLKENKENMKPGDNGSGTHQHVPLSRSTGVLCQNEDIINTRVKPCPPSSLHYQLQKAEEENIRLRRRILVYQSQQHNERRQLTRAQSKLSNLCDKFRDIVAVSKRQVKQWERERNAVLQREEDTRLSAELVVRRVGDDNAKLHDALVRVCREVQVLKKRCARFPKILERKLLKARNQPLTLRLRNKGTYTAQARLLARTLVRVGCAQERVGDVIRMMGKEMGISVEGAMSARTARRAMLELGAASDIQTAVEVLQAKCFTVSGDATTDRHVNYEARHMLLMLPSSDGHSLKPVNRLLGVESTVDHTSNTQLKGWLHKFEHIADAFNNSPYSRRNGLTIDLTTFALKLKGVGGDHAADQLKTTRQLQDWKRDMTYLSLARDHLARDAEPSLAVRELSSKVTTAAIAAAGGLAAWEALDANERVGVYAHQLEQALLRLGKETFEDLPSGEQRQLTLFARLGCAMHKDLNAVKGGNAAMMRAYDELGLTPPILLANRDNASTLQDIDPALLNAAASSVSLSQLTPAELRAFEASTRGAVKLTSLAGSLFNHQDDKKGQHDTYLFYFREVVGKSVRFPDTSNTRYQSHCAAAAELLVNREHYLRFLEYVRDHKVKPGFSHLEENVYRGLQDPRTLSELAVLALYAQAVTHLYMRVVRQPNLNGLRLGPLHEQVKEYIKALIKEPDVLLLPGPGHDRTPALDALTWERPEVIATIHRMLPDLPNIRPLLVRFLGGTLTTWEKFTVEFAKGGVIDSMSAAELDEIWIQPTNDHNEGVLGSKRLDRRAKPTATQALFNAQKKAERNGTEEFIATHLNTEEDGRHLRAVVRVMESEHHEAKRQKELTDHFVQVAQTNADNLVKKQQRLDEEIAALKQQRLIVERSELEKLTREEMDLQLEIYGRVHNVSGIPKKSKMSRRAEKLAALLAAIEYRLQACAGERVGNVSTSDHPDTDMESGRSTRS